MYLKTLFFFTEEISLMLFYSLFIQAVYELESPLEMKYGDVIVSDAFQISIVQIVWLCCY